MIMLNHFNSISKGSFNSGEKRFVFQNAETPETHDVAEEYNRLNPSINANLNDFYDSLLELRDEDLNINHEIEEDILVMNITHALDDTYDADSASSLSVELVDALTDNETFMRDFGEDALANPQNHFQRIVISNGFFELSGDTDFRIALEDLQSDHLTELIAERDAAVADTGDTARAQIDEQLGDVLAADETYEDVASAGRLDETATAEEFTEEVDHQALRKIQYIADLIISDIDITDSTIINGAIDDWMRVGGDFEDYLSSLSPQELNPIFEESALLSGENPSDILSQFTDEVEGEVEDAENMRQRALERTVDTTVEAAPAVAADPEASQALDETLATIGEDSPSITSGHTNAEYIENFLRENLPQQTLEGIQSFFRGVARALSILETNQAAETTETARSQAAEDSVAPTESRETSEEQTVALLTRDQALEQDSERLVEGIREQIQEHSEDPDNFNSYELPEEFQGANYNENRFRLLLTSGRIANADQIYLEMEDLDLSANDLARSLNYSTVTGRRNGRNLERIDLIQNTAYGEESMEEFMTRLAEIQNDTDNRTEYLDRLSVYNRMNNLVSLLEGLVLQDDFTQVDINPDNIQDVDINRDAIRALRDAGLNDRPRGSEHTLLMAFYVHLYGPLERLIDSDHIEVEQRSDFNVRRQNQYRININSIPEEHREALAQAYNRFSGLARDSEGNMENFRSLTDALSEIRNSDQYTNVREMSYETASELLSEDASDEERIFVLLHRIFDVNYTGPYFRNGRRSVTMFDIVGDGVRGAHEADSTSAQLGDLSMFNYLVNTFVDYGEGPASFTYENLESELNHLIANGRVAAQIQAFSLQRENEEQYNALIAAEDVTVENLRSGNITEEQIMAIRQGILFEASLVEAQHTVSETTEETPQSNGFITEVATYFAQQGMPEEDLQRISASVFNIVAGADFTDNQSRLDTQFDNPDFAGLANINFYTYRDENGERQVAWGEANENGDVSTYFTMSPGVGNILEPSNIMLDPENVLEVLSINMAFGVNDFGANDRGEFEMGGSATGAGANAYITIGGEVGARRRWRMDLTAGAAGTYNLMPVPFVTLGAERTMGGRIERQINNNIEGTRFAEMFTQDEIELMARDQLSESDMIAIASRPGEFADLVAELAEQNQFTEDQLDSLKLDLVQTLVNAMVNEGVEDLNAFAFNGLSVTFVPPAIIIPSISFSIMGRNKTYYSAEHTTANVESYSESQILASLDISNPQPESESYFILPTQSVDIVVDADGNRTLSRVTEVFATNPETGERLEDDFESLVADSQEQRLLDALNTRTETTGLTFDRLDLAEGHPQNDDFDFAFSIGDYNSDLSQYGVSRQTEILASRYSGITIEPIEGEHNLFGIRFGNNAGDLPAEPVIMARQDITSPYGLSPTRTIISFNSGEYTEASEIRNNPFLENILYVDSEGNAELRRNRHFLEMEDIPEFTVDNVRDMDEELDLLRAVTDDEYRASQALYETLTLEGGVNGFEYSEQLTQELTDLCNRLLEDDEFLQRVREATTIQVDIDPENYDITDFPDFNELATAIKGEYPELNDASISYIISRLTPGTLLRVNDVPVSERREYVNQTTRLTTRVVAAMAEDLEYTEDEAAAIANTIIDLNIIDEDSTEEVLQNIFSDEVVTEPFPGTESRDGENLEADEDGIRDITANHIYTMVGSSGVVGLRETIFDFEAEQALGDEGSPQIINHSLRRLDLQDDAHRDVADFLYKLYEPQVDQGELDAIFTSGFDSGNFEGLPDNETLQSVLHSNSALQLLSLNMNTRDGDILSVVSYYLNEDQDPSNTIFLNELYTYIRETSAGREATMPEMTAERARVLQTFVNWTMQILNTSPSESTVLISDPETGEELFQVNSNIEAGTFLIRECANLSFYFDREMTASLDFERPADFGTGAAEADTIYAGGRPRTTRSESELNLVAAFDVDREGKIDAPTYDEEEVEENEDGERYRNEDRVANPTGEVLTGDETIEITEDEGGNSAGLF